MNTCRNVALIVSLLANLALAGYVLLDRLNSPSGELGVLTRDVTARFHDGSGTEFRLPKGMTVRNESPRGLAGAGVFEPHRFAIVVMADDSSAVSYGPGNRVSPIGELYDLVPAPGQ